MPLSLIEALAVNRTLTRLTRMPGLLIEEKTMVIKWSKRIWLVLLVSLLMLPATGSAGYSNVFILGDSLSDTGNLLTATADPQLQPFFPTPLPQDPPYFNGRFSDGPVYAEHLWTALKQPGSLQPSYRGGTDYAVGGARSRYHAFDVSNPLAPINPAAPYYGFSLLGQRDALLADHPQGLDAGALYTVWEGSNDVSDAITLWLKGAASTALALIDQAVGDFIAVVKDIVAKGAHYLLIPNVPNLGLVPEVVVLGSGAQGLATQLSLRYNQLIDLALDDVDASITRLDTFSILSDLIADPAAHGLPADAKVKTACFTGFIGQPGDVCDDPQNYVFWDKIHPSAVVHAELGRLAAAAVAEPAPIMLIALAMLVLGYSRRHLAWSGRRIARPI